MPHTTKLADRKFILLDNGQTPTYAEDVISRINAGESIDQIAEHLQVSDSHIRTWLKRNGYSPMPRPVMWGAEPIPVPSE